MEVMELNNGLSMPMVGFGTWDLRGPDCADAVARAIACGYRLIDTARMYGNEAEVGRGIRRSGVDRSELFLTTKVYRPDNSYAGVRRAIEASLQALDTGYIDLYLIHEPYREAPEMYRALEEAYRQGLLRAIGVSNFNACQYEALLESCQVIPAVNQVEAHVFFAQRPLQAVLERHGTRMEAWSPFAAGKLDLFHNPVLTAVGRRHGRTAAQVALRYLISRGIAVIPKSAREERMRANLAVFYFQLTPEDIGEIEALDTGRTLFGWYS